MLYCLFFIKMFLFFSYCLFFFYSLDWFTLQDLKLSNTHYLFREEGARLETKA